MGKKRTKDCRAHFRVKYEEGTIEAAAYDERGKEIGRNLLQSASGEIRIFIKPEETEICAGEICYIPITLAGENGVTESNADRRLSVRVKNGTLLAFGSANPRTEERYDSGSFTTYYGRALAVVRGERKGVMTVRVTDGNQESSAAINVTK